MEVRAADGSVRVCLYQSVRRDIEHCLFFLFYSDFPECTNMVVRKNMVVVG